MHGFPADPGTQWDGCVRPNHLKVARPGPSCENSRPTQDGVSRVLSRRRWVPPHHTTLRMFCALTVRTALE